MQDNIRVTTPIQTNDTAGRLRPSKETPILNPVDPSRVNPGNTSENAQNAKNDGNFNFLLNQNSVYNKFIQQLVQTPGLSQTLKKIMFEAFVMTNKPKGLSKSGALNDLLSEMASKLNLNEQEIVEALQYQSDNQTKYSGKMFDLLRELLTSPHDTKEYEVLLGRFLKAYNGYFSAGDTLKAIIQNLKTISAYMPKSYQVQLNELVDKIIINQPTTSLDINLATLKSEVIPFLSDYIAHTNDFGRVRDTITLLINNIARLNTSSKEDIITKFVDLLDYCKFHFDMADDKINYIKSVFAHHLNEMQKPQNEMFDLMAKLISEGSNGEGQSATTKAMYRDVVNSLLLDNSVFMPLTHLFLPINYHGTFMFSEIWIDKNARKKDGTKNENGVPTTKLFVTFDIKGLGYFEATVWLTNKLADVELNYPDVLANKDRDIKNNIARIVTNNGFTLNSVVLLKGQPPKQIHKVFESLYESRRGMDVTI